MGCLGWAHPLLEALYQAGHLQSTWQPMSKSISCNEFFGVRGRGGTGVLSFHISLLGNT